MTAKVVGILSRENLFGVLGLCHGLAQGRWEAGPLAQPEKGRLLDGNPHCPVWGPPGLGARADFIPALGGSGPGGGLGKTPACDTMYCAPGGTWGPGAAQVSFLPAHSPLHVSYLHCSARPLHAQGQDECSRHTGTGGGTAR